MYKRQAARAWLSASSLGREAVEAPSARAGAERYLIAAALRNGDSKGGMKRWCDAVARLSTMLAAKGEAGAFPREEGFEAGISTTLPRRASRREPF